MNYGMKIPVSALRRETIIINCLSHNSGVGHYLLLETVTIPVKIIHLPLYRGLFHLLRQSCEQVENHLQNK